MNPRNSLKKFIKQTRAMKRILSKPEIAEEIEAEGGVTEKEREN